ncbi:MAG: hypothetical protein ACO263_06650 [Cyclobacteriaceae bacterium]
MPAAKTIVIRFLLALSLVTSVAVAQQGPAEALQKYSASRPGEKIFAHLSQSDLITGELLWFSLFVTDAQSHRPSALSKMAYVELLGRDNKVVLQDKIVIDGGSGYGSFYLPATLQTGKYLFRAYTSWMKNSSPEFYFHREIQIVNTLRAPESVTSSIGLTRARAEFFPEGGYLVDGLPSRVGVHVYDEKGSGAEATGFIFSKGDTVARFSTKKFGFSDFKFTPKSDRSYTVVLKDLNGQAIAAQLPEIRKSGMTLNVKPDPNGNVKVDVYSSTPDRSENLRLVLHCRSVVSADRSVTLRDGRGQVELSATLLAPGINHLTFFNEQMQPILERLYFKKPDVQSLTVQSGQSVYAIRSKGRIGFSGIQDSLTRLSVSVVHADSLVDYDDITSYLYLSSDLHGKVESPAFYFSDGPEVSAVADLLMLTHGWRRFDWKELFVQASPEPRYLPELKSHLITAKFEGISGTDPVAGKTAYLSSPGKMIRLYTARSDESGRLYFEVKPGQVGGRLIIQPEKNDSTLRVVAEDPFSSAFKNWNPQDVRLFSSQAAALTQRSIDMQVQDIYREQETFFSRSTLAADSTPFYGQPDEQYQLDDYVRFPSLEEVMREFVKGVWVRKRAGHFRLIVQDKEVNRMFNESPMLLLDGVPVADADKLFEVDALKIKRIDVIARKYFTGPLVSEGLISLSTYDGQMAGLSPDPRSAVVDLTSLEEKRIFKAPAYTTIQSRDDRMPDRRRLLYFNHNLMTSSTNGEIEFFTSDTEGKFLIRLNGLSSAGVPISGLAWFTVSR